MEVVEHLDDASVWELPLQLNTARVYLSGPITGLTWPQAAAWREVAEKMLAERHVRAISPMRGLEALHKVLGDSKKIPAIGDLRAKCPEFDIEALVERDITDVMGCDVMLVNLLPSAAADPMRGTSIGTLVEAGLARASFVPVVAVGPSWSAMFRHPMFCGCLAARHEIQPGDGNVPEEVIDEVAKMAKEMLD